MTTREKDFERICAGLEGAVHATSSQAIVAEGDSLELLKKIPSHTVSLVLTDPPYHSTKKANIYGDTHFSEDAHYLEWMSKYAVEWRRILRPNGSLFCFCASEMAARLEVQFARDFNILSQVVWTKPNEPGFDGWKGKMSKEALRQWYPHSERILFAEPALDGNLHRSPFGIYLREMRKKAGLTSNELTELTGAYGRVNHGGAVSNWETGRNVPSREQYEKIRRVIIRTGKVVGMPPYEDVVRPFMMDASKEFTDIWTFSSVRPYRGKHPAEKPLELLEHAIEATTFPGDIVMDCFAGSGNTGVAAIKLGRRALAIEIDGSWVRQAARRMEMESLKPPTSNTSEPQREKSRKGERQLGLFLGVK